MTDESEPGAVAVPETPLDEAMKHARQNPGEGNYFYDQFLNTDLFMPVRISDQKEGTGRELGWNEKFHPLFLKYGETRVVALFDTLERMRAWEKATSLDYLHLRFHVLLGTLAPGVAAVLNLGTPWVHYFTPDVLDQLRQAMKPVEPS